jgi:hypothetical protein
MAADLACRPGGRACVQDIVDPGRGAYAVQIRGQGIACPFAAVLLTLAVTGFGEPG